MRRTQPATLLLLATIFAAGCHDSAAPATPETPLLIWSERAQGEGLYLMSLDGRRAVPVPLPDAPVDFDRSPDGARIVYSGRYEAQLFVADALGGNVVQLTSSTGPSGLPAWSPDGSRILYWNGDDPYDWGLMVMNADGSGQQRLPATQYAAVDRPSWAPDSRRFVFALDETRPIAGTTDYTWTTSLFVADLESSTATRLTSGAECSDRDPAWSPDGSAIAFTGCRDGVTGVFLIAPDGSNVRRVVATPRGSFDGDPSWSPTSDRLVFDRTTPQGVDVFSVWLDGSHLADVTGNNPGVDVRPRWHSH